MSSPSSPSAPEPPPLPPAVQHPLARSPATAPPQWQQYGQPPSPEAYSQPFPPGPGAGNGIGIAGGVVGIVAAVLFWVPYIGLTLGIVAVTLGAVGLGRARRMGGASKGMSITGIVCGSIAVVVGLLFLVLILGTVATFHRGP